MQKIRHLLTNESQFSGFISNGNTYYESYLWGLSHINMMVGPNNTGKSRFIRTLIGSKEIRFFPWTPNEHLEKINESELTRFQKMKSVMNFLEVDVGTDSIMQLISQFSLGGGRGTYSEVAYGFVSKALAWLKKHPQLRTSQSVSDFEASAKQWIDASARLYESADDLKLLSREAVKDKPWRRLYIPTLRGIRPINPTSDLYRQATERDYPNLKENKCDIFTGQTLYEDVRKLLCGKHSERKKIQLFENYLGETFFAGRTVALIPLHDGNGSLDIKIGNEPQFPIQHLGDGVQAIITIVFPLFIRPEEPTLVAIEEPELNLHPGMQRTLIEALRRFKHCQFFLPTHSNHLLDLTLGADDISVYAMEKYLEAGESDERNANTHIELVSHGDVRTLELLGTMNSSVFLANCTIWVEGITDRRYLSHYFKLYQQYLGKVAKQEENLKMLFQEDLHFAFVEYGGSNITHWSWLDDVKDPINVERICGRFMVIADNDNVRDGSKKAIRHAKLQMKLKERFILLQSREIENLISVPVMAGYLRSLGVDDCDQYLKNEEDLKNRRLGSWIDRVASDCGVQAKKHGKGGVSDTIQDKITFANAIIDLTQSYEDLSMEAKRICQKIYEFIESNNKLR